MSHDEWQKFSGSALTQTYPARLASRPNPRLAHGGHNRMRHCAGRHAEARDRPMSEATPCNAIGQSHAVRLQASGSLHQG